MNSDDRPPVFKTWNGAYLLVLGTLAAVVGLFSLISWIYR
jgi:hypothetical protein